jgi:hypothetical protein
MSRMEATLMKTAGLIELNQMYRMTPKKATRIRRALQLNLAILMMTSCKCFDLIRGRG